MIASPTILFGHPAFQLGDALRRRGADAAVVEARSLDAVEARIAEADVLVVSRLWRNDWIERATRLTFIQAVSAGTEQFDHDRLRAKGVRLASAQGVNTNAVADHAMGMILSFTRRLHGARDHQRQRHWRGILSDPATREMELDGATLLVVGLGQIGSRIATRAKAFGMRVIGIRRRSGATTASVDAVWGSDRLDEALRQADVVVLSCPLTPDTEGLIGPEALAAMPRSAILINVARGAVVDEPALIRALETGAIAGAGLDCFGQEPLPAASPLWGFDNVLITSHNAGDSRSYEIRVIDILLDNLARLSRGETELRNQVV